MVELWFGGNIGLWFNAWDVRSVIKNATKDPNMSESKDKTIMNKEEINKKKVAKNTKTKVQPIGWTQIWWFSGVGGININQTPKNTQTQTPKIQNNNIWGNFGMNFWWLPGWVWEIWWIKVGSVNWEPTTTQTPTTETMSNDEKMINSRGRLTALKDVVDVDSVLEDLYLDVWAGLKNWTLADVDVNNVKQIYSELAWLDDQVVLDLIADLWSLHQKWLPFNAANLEKLKQWYPELKGVGRWFTTPAEQNMYQWWGFKEAMNEWSATDLNKYWVGWKAAETIVNPIGQATTVLDAAAQQIPQVTGKKYEDKLKKELSNLTDEQIDRYYEQYKNLVSQWKLKWYTTRVKWNTLVGQMWSAIFGNEKNGRKYQDVEWWFRQWLIDQVNADVNGFAWYLMDAQYFDQDVWPNLAKMYANIPWSAVKTVTAITRAMTNPLDTLSWLTTLLFTEQWHEALKARYGSWEAIAKTMEQDPVWLASDMLAVAEWGAWLAKWGVKLGKLWTKWASLATYVLWAEKTSEWLLKIANRLERLEWKIGWFKTMAGEASDMWMRKFIYWEELPNWVRKWWLINALEQRASEWDSLTNKAAWYLAKTQQPLKTAWEVVRKTKEAGWVTWRIAQKITGSATAEDKLFQAASPNINRLTRWVDYKNKRANMDLANKAIIEAWYTPKNTAERVVAHLETLNKRWKEFTDKVKWKADVDVSSERLAKVLEDHINAAWKNITENQRSDINALQKEIKSLKWREKFNMIDLEDYKENINADTRNKTQTAKSDIYIRWMKKLSEEIGKIQNEILSNAPDEVKNLKRTIGALLDTKDDVIKANVKNLKKKEWGWLVESYSRIQWVADIVGWGLSILSRWWEWVKDVAKWVGKVVLWKALWKAKDVDWLTKQWFEWLRKKYEWKWLEWWKIEWKSVETKGAKTKKWEKWLKFQKWEEGDYDKALSAAYRKWERKNKVLSESEQKRVKWEIEKKAKNAWFVTKLFDNMVDAVKKSGWEAKEWDIIHGFTNIKDKVIALSKNPLDTTAQHELFHAVFDVVDKKSKWVVLDEAKKFLEERLWKAVSDSIAEEWLAESFWIYMRDKMIDLWIIDKAKWIAWLKQKVEKLFQRWYEWMQNYNADRFLINDFFNAMREGKGLNKKWTMDLSYLWKNKWVEWKWIEGGKWVKYQKSGVKHIEDWKGGLLQYKDWYLKYYADKKVMTLDYIEAWTKRQGIGTKLLQEAEKVAKKKWIKKIKLFADAFDGIRDVDLRKFYEKQWFKVDDWDEIGGKKIYDMSKNIDNKWLKYQKDSYSGELNPYFKLSNGLTVKEAIQDLRKKWLSIKEAEQEIQKQYNQQIQDVMNKYKKEHWLLEGGTTKANKTVNAEWKKLSVGQQKYFANSKVRERDWTLKIVYHWTPNNFTVFDKGRIWANTKDYWYYWAWFYFTDFEGTAQTYVDYHKKWMGSEGQIMKWYMNIEKPFKRSEINTKEKYDQIMKEMPELKGILRFDGHMLREFSEFTKERSKQFSEILQKHWYDWIIVRDWQEIIAFDSNQFKNIDNLNPTKNEDIRYQKWWHWSPAEFKKFDSTHMWEWEWTQAHGWWHYIAVKEDTAKKYAEMRGWITYKWRELGELATSSNVKDNVAFEIIRDGNRINDYWKAKENLIKTREQQYNNNIDMFGEGMKWLTNENVRKWMIAKQKELADKIQTAKELDVSEFKKLEHNLYELDIPDPEKRNTPTWKNYLDESEVLSKAVWSEFHKKADQYAKEKWIESEKDRFNGYAKLNGYRLYKQLSRYLGWDKEASKFLEKIWYDWIHYIWWIDWEAYVIFKDQNVNIKNHLKYQKEGWKWLTPKKKKKWLQLWRSALVHRWVRYKDKEEK